MTDTELKRREAICKAAGVNDIGELSDGFHTFNGLYEQRMILFAALVKAYKDRAWKSYRHEDGEWCFGGGWFIVGIDTPEGSYTYHYENKYWDMFDCADLPRGKHWDGHTEDDAETRLMSLEPERKNGKWIPCSERLPEVGGRYLVTRGLNACGALWNRVYIINYSDLMGLKSRRIWWDGNIGKSDFEQIDDVIAWMPLPEPYGERRTDEID